MIFDPRVMMQRQYGLDSTDRYGALIFYQFFEYVHGVSWRDIFMKALYHVVENVLLQTNLSPT